MPVRSEGGKYLGAQPDSSQCGPDAQQREVQAGEHRGVRQLDDDPVQPAQTHIEQHPGQPLGPLA